MGFVRIKLFTILRNFEKYGIETWLYCYFYIHSDLNQCYFFSFHIFLFFINSFLLKIVLFTMSRVRPLGIPISESFFNFSNVSNDRSPPDGFNQKISQLIIKIISRYGVINSVISLYQLRGPLVFSCWFLLF